MFITFQRVKSTQLTKRKKPSDEGDAANGPPQKRLRVETSQRTSTSAQSSTAPRPSGQIISSLFTSNPAPTIEPPSSPIRDVHHAPSNAPLLDSSSFDNLGLNPLLGAHLKTRLNIQKPTSIQRAVISSLIGFEASKSRDLFIQSQTGSGKTLSFLLPIVHDLLPLSSLSYIDRSIGTLAIIIAPTRELAKQISDVLETLLQLRLSPRESERPSDEAGPRLTRWLISGLLSGGATRTHEKARLRKGVPILVSTPGRLLDHLQKTESFHVAKCRWLVFDEADRLMELGFQETLEGIIKCLDGRRKLAMNAAKDGGGLAGEVVGGWDWGARRRNILCSATIREDVQKLAGMALNNPLVIKGGAPELLQEPNSSVAENKGQAVSEPKFAPPSQLSQRYLVVPLKLRLVTLVSLLRSILARAQRKARGTGGTKIIVFLSCTDSVDFHWDLIGGTSMNGGTENSDGTQASGEEMESSNADISARPRKGGGDIQSTKVATSSALLPNTLIYRLHGSLPLSARLASLKGFSSKSPQKSSSLVNSSILLCTSVASRGLDLPLVTAVVQYDLPTEGGANEYVHRVGRTARVGQGGEAWSFVAPEEIAWVKWVEEHMNTAKGSENSQSAKLTHIEVEEILGKGLGGKGAEVHDRATEVQLAFERWVLSDKIVRDV
ncbi:ATP-dependent RNA helicase dbp7 [Tulasnella sp. 418]|nr:ATP-dependent RNA helicase dbp7 [Tulasnella sp. 418]